MTMSFFLFFLFWVSLIGFAHWYVGRRVINAANLQRKQRRIAWLVVGIIFLIPQVPFFFFLNRMQSAWLDVFSWAGYVVLGFFSLVLTLVLLRDIALLARRSTEKIDFAVSSIMALNGCLTNPVPEEQVSVYETQGLLII